MSLDTGAERTAKERVYIVRVWLSFLFFVLLSLFDLSAFIPGFNDSHWHLFYIHAFLIMLCAGYVIPVWAYIIAAILFDMIYGFAAFNIPIMAIFAFALLPLRARNFSWQFLYSWCVFSMMVVAAEALRYLILNITKDVNADFTGFAQVMALNIVCFPLGFAALSRLYQRGAV